MCLRKFSLDPNVITRWFVSSFRPQQSRSMKKRVLSCFIFARENNFNGLFGDVRIELHFPLVRPQGNSVKVIGKEVWHFSISVTFMNSDESSAKSLIFDEML